MTAAVLRYDLRVRPGLLLCFQYEFFFWRGQGFSDKIIRIGKLENHVQIVDRCASFQDDIKVKDLGTTQCPELTYKLVIPKIGRRYIDGTINKLNSKCLFESKT